MDNHNTPILFLVFNRPDTTKLVFEKIKEAKPQKLYIAADGPRKEKEGEAEKAAEVRKICSDINWNCEVHTLYRDTNLGCGKAVSEAITWFFEQEEEGIILEDDCLPDISFFRFCSELLVRYRDEEKVMSISGTNLLNYPWRVPEQSYFWGLGGIWGWATWKRAWDKYDYTIKGWGNDSVKKQLETALYSEEWFKFYYPMFDASFNGTLDTWDIQWLYTILINGGLSINPEVNLVKNIGFGSDSTHTRNTESSLASITINTISFPLMHPNHRIVDVKQLNLMYKVIQPIPILQKSLPKRILNFFRV